MRENYYNPFRLNRQFRSYRCDSVITAVKKNLWVELSGENEIGDVGSSGFFNYVVKIS